MSHSSAFADEYDHGYSTGYESYVKIPKEETRGKLTDAELLVLPPFGYDLLSRNKFDKAFVGVIRRHGTAWNISYTTRWWEDRSRFGVSL